MVAGPPPRSVGRPASLSDPLSVSWDPAPSRLFWTRGFFCSCSFLFFFVFSPDVFRAAAPGGGRRVCDVCVCVANGLINGRAENNASRAAWSLSRVVLVARQHDCVHAPFAGRGRTGSGAGTAGRPPPQFAFVVRLSLVFSWKGKASCDTFAENRRFRNSNQDRAILVLQSHFGDDYVCARDNP